MLRPQPLRLVLQCLEERTTPATLVNPTMVTYQDADGDDVIVKFTKPVLTATNVNDIFKFDTGTVDGANTTKQQLRKITLLPLATAGRGLGITTTATVNPTNGGDGLGAIGEIVAYGPGLGESRVAIGNITIDGDLARLVAGEPGVTKAIGNVKVDSLGRYGTTTGAVFVGLTSNGSMGSLTVANNLQNIGVNTSGIGPITIQGAMSGSAIFGTTGSTVTINGEVNSSRITLDSASVLKFGGNVINSGISLEKAKSITIPGDFVGGANGSDFTGITVFGSLAQLTIGGDLVGNAGGGSGSVSVETLGKVSIGGDVIGGTGAQSGRIHASQSMGNVTITGSLLGNLSLSAGTHNGQLVSQGPMGKVSIGGDVVGGATDSSGYIHAYGTLASATVGGSLLGNAGLNSGGLFSGENMGPVSIGQNVVGSSGDSSAAIRAGVLNTFGSNGSIASLKVGGAITGGGGIHSAEVHALSKVGNVTVSGSIVGGAGESSGAVYGTKGVGNLTFGGNLQAGAGFKSGRVTTGYVLQNEPIGAVSITGSMIGGAVFATLGKGPVTIGGNIDGGGLSFKTVASVTVNGSLLGGTGTGTIYGDIGSLKIMGDVVGGATTNTGYISGDMKSIYIGGDIIGGAGNASGKINAHVVSSLTVMGDIVGGSTSAPGGLIESGFVVATRFLKLTVNGAVIAGTDNTSGPFRYNGAIGAREDIVAATIGRLQGNSTNLAVISAFGQATPSGSKDVAIGKLTVVGAADMAHINAGYYISPGNNERVNADAQIGSIIVNGAWTASNITAGVQATNAFFGDDDDAKYVVVGPNDRDATTRISKIGSVHFKGAVTGTVGGTDVFGIVAENVGSVKVGTTTLALTATDDDVTFGTTNDLHVNEL